jgi:hypothetical protein
MERTVGELRGRSVQSAEKELELIARAVELGLGVDGPGKIQFVTGDAESETYAAQIQEMLAHG